MGLEVLFQPEKAIFSILLWKIYENIKNVISTGVLGLETSWKHPKHHSFMFQTPQKHLEKIFSSHFDHQNSIFWTSKNFQILLDWVDQAEKKWIPDLYEPVKNFLGIQHPWCGYLKHSSGSGLSNARTLMSVRHTQTKRHRVFWFTVINSGLRHLLDFTCLIWRMNFKVWTLEEN